MVENLKMTWLKQIFRKNNSQTLIKSIEDIYFDLKSKNPDKDDHWLLANVFLKRYGNRGEAKQKGPELMRYIAYKDTFQFSVLGSPKSIRAFVLFVIYKELGDKEAEAKEFSELMNSVQRMQEEHRLIDEYRKRNPFTWNEIQAEKDSGSRYNLYGFLKAADELQDPEISERVQKELENLENR